MALATLDPSCALHPLECLGNAVTDSLTGSVFEQLRDGVLDGVAQFAASLGTMWVSVPTIAVTASSKGAPSDTVEFIQSSLWILTLALLTVSLIVGGSRMVLERRGEPFMDVLKGLFTFVIISGGGLFALSLILGIVDELSNWIIARSVKGTDFGENIVTLLQMGSGSSLAILVTITAGTIAMLVSLVQIAMMVLRAAILPILAGVWPTAAAFSGTPAGKRWFEKITSWIIAFAFYKLAAAIVYATAFRMMGADVFGGDDSGLIQVIAGILLMVVAVVALPALVRLFAPMVGAVTSGSGGGGMAAAGGMAMMASGAIHGGGKGSSSSSGSSGSSGSVGASGSSGPSGASGVSSGSGSSSGAGDQGGAVPSQRGAGAGAPNPAMAGAGAGSGGGAAGGGAGAASGGAAAGGGSASGGAAAGAGAGAGAAAAAGPAAPAVMGAQAAVGAVQAAANQVKQSAESATGEGPSGAN